VPRLPDASSLQRRPAPALTPDIRVKPIDYDAAAKGSKALGAGLSTLAAGIGQMGEAAAEVDDYGARKALLDFQLKTEMDLEEHKRTAMQPGGAGFAADWQKQYDSQAKEFFKTIPESQRRKVDLALVQHSVRLGERAQREEMAERDRSEIEGLDQTLSTTRGFVEADPGRRDEMLAEGRKLIELSRITPAAKDRLARKYGVELDKTAAISRLMKAQTVEEFDSLRQDLAPEAPDKRAPIINPTITPSGDMSIITGRSGARLRVSSTYAERFAGLIADLEAEGVEIKPDQSGGYANRNIRGTNTPSRHSHGEAIDINWSENARGTKGSIRQIGEDKIRALAAKHGLKWGGDWKNPDDMHFEVDRSASPARSRPGVYAAGSSEDSQTGGYGGPYSHLTISERKALWTQAEVQRKRLVGEVEKVIKEQMTVASDGYLPPAPVLAELEKRVQAIGDPMLKAHYAAMVMKADITQNLNKMSPPLIEEYARRERDRAAQSGATKEQLEAVQHVEKVAEAARKAVDTDPLSWAHRNKVPIAPTPEVGPGGTAPREPVQLEQLDFSAADIDQRLSRRADQARVVGQYYNQLPQFFTKIEREALTEIVKNGGPNMLFFASKIYSAFGTDAPLAFKEISKDAPEVAMIGKMVADGANPKLLEDAAKGLYLRKTEGDKFSSRVDRKMAEPDVAGVTPVLRMTPGLVDPVIRTTNAIYEYRHRYLGKDKFDADLYRQTMQEVLGRSKDEDGTVYGGIGMQGTGWFDGKWSAANVIVPPAVRADSFDAFVDLVQERDLERLGRPLHGNGKPLTAAEVRAAQWQSVGAARYALKTGESDNGTAQYAMDPVTGSPYVLDLRPLMGEFRSRKPDIFRKQ
jgi:hypothetical protein